MATAALAQLQGLTLGQIEYGAEVAQQHTLAEELLFIQHSRSALERAVAHGSSRLLWRWQDGSRSEVHFRRENNHISMRVRQKSV